MTTQQPEALRQTLQAQGTHPAPCARHCEAQAFNIELRRLHQSEREGWRYASELEQERKQLHDLLGKANALARIRAERVKELTAINAQLLEALQTVMGDANHGQHMSWSERCRQARAAIKAAKG